MYISFYKTLTCKGSYPETKEFLDYVIYGDSKLIGTLQIAHIFYAGVEIDGVDYQISPNRKGSTISEYIISRENTQIGTILIPGWFHHPPRIHLYQNDAYYIARKHLRYTQLAESPNWFCFHPDLDLPETPPLLIPLLVFLAELIVWESSD